MRRPSSANASGQQISTAATQRYSLSGSNQILDLDHISGARGGGLGPSEVASTSRGTSWKPDSEMSGSSVDAWNHQMQARQLATSAASTLPWATTASTSPSPQQQYQGGRLIGSGTGTASNEESSLRIPTPLAAAVAAAAAASQGAAQVLEGASNREDGRS